MRFARSLPALVGQVRADLHALAERLVDAGHPPAAVDAAIALIRAGNITLLQRVLDRELKPEQAWEIVRRRGRA